MEKSFGKREFFLLIAVVSIVLTAYLFRQNLYQEPASIVEISVIDSQSEKVVLKTFDLTENLEYSIQTEPDGLNHLVIQNGNVWISSANCPNHDCVRQGTISQNGEMLVCIPHRLTVSIINR